MNNEELFAGFIGPKGENIPLLKKLINQVLNHQQQWRESFFPNDNFLPFEPSESFPKLEKALDDLLKQASNNFPFFHPRYSAQMLKDPSLPTLLGYLTFMMSNPNNHAYEGGPVTTMMEMNVVDQLLRLTGYTSGWGHLTSGGSLANMEALWAVRDKYKNNGTVYFSEVSHYSWKRICGILAIPSYQEIEVDEQFHLDCNKLEENLKKHPGLMVVANAGSTGTGSIDAISDILTLRDKYGFHLHIDAAYGGFSRSLLFDSDYNVLEKEFVPDLTPYAYTQIKAIEHSDSLTIDPHKQGLISYGAGAVLFADTALRDCVLNTAPYTYHVTDKPNIGMFSLEGSRPGAMAAACYLTYSTYPLHRDGIGNIISASLLSARNFGEQLIHSGVFEIAHIPDLDIVCFFPSGEQSVSKINQLSLDVYSKLSVENPDAEFILSKFVITPEIVERAFPLLLNPEKENLIILRSVFLKHWNGVVGSKYNEELVRVLVNTLQGA